MNPVGVGIIGCGNISLREHAPAMQTLAGLAITANVEPELRGEIDRLRAALAAAEDRYRRLAGAVRRSHRLRALLTPAGTDPQQQADVTMCTATDHDLVTNRPLRCDRRAHDGGASGKPRHHWVYADTPAATDGDQP